MRRGSTGRLDARHGSPVLRRARQRRAGGATRPQHGSVSAALRQRRAGVGSRRARDGRAPAGAAPASAGRVAPLAALQFTMADVYPPTHWAIRGDAARVRHAGRRRLPDGPQSRAARQGGRRGARSIASAASRSVRWQATRFPTRRPSSSRRWRTRCRSGSRTRSRSPRHFATLHKEDVDQARRGARRAVRVDAVVHEPAGRAARERGAVLHCGACSKCRERRDAFAAAGLTDPAALCCAYLEPGYRMADA